MPLLAADVALLAGRDQREEPLVPDLVVRVVDRDAVVLEALRVGLRQRLRDDLADPAAGEALLDRLRVAAVEVRLGEALDRGGDRAAGERVGVARALVVAVDQRERLEHVLDRLHARVRPAGLLVLAPVVVDVAEAALLLGAEVLAEPQHGQVDQVAPLDRRRGLHHRLAVGERVAVVLGHRRQRDLGQLAAVEREPQPVLGARDAVGRVRVDAHRDDRAAQPHGPPVSAISSGGRCVAAAPSSVSGFWSNEKMKYDFGLTPPSRLSVRALSSNAIPVRRRSSFSTASGGIWG